jgi:hypothetical protein
VSRPRPLLAARSALAVVGVALVLLSGATVAAAAFRGAVMASTSVGTTSVSPPTKFAATTTCGKKTGTVVFTWTPTGSVYADGYELLYTAGGTSRIIAVPQRSTTSTSFSVSSGVTYVFTLVATSPSSWTSITNPTLPAITCP